MGVWASIEIYQHQGSQSQILIECCVRSKRLQLHLAPAVFEVQVLGPRKVEAELLATTCHELPQVLELLEHKAIFTAGYKCVLHVHSVVEECECVKLIALMDPKTKEKKRVRRTSCFAATAGCGLFAPALAT